MHLGSSHRTNQSEKYRLPIHIPLKILTNHHTASQSPSNSVTYPKISRTWELVAEGQPMLALGRRPSGRAFCAACASVASLRPAFHGISGPPIDSIATTASKSVPSVPSVTGGRHGTTKWSPIYHGSAWQIFRFGQLAKFSQSIPDAHMNNT